MAQMVLADRAKGLLNSTISDTATTFTMSVLNDANKFPSLDGSTGDYFYAYFSDAAGNVEKIKVTYRQNTTFGNGTYPCVRGIDTTARSWPGVGGGNDTIVALRVGKREFEEHGHAIAVITGLQAALDAKATTASLSAHTGASSGAHAASAISVTSHPQASVQGVLDGMFPVGAIYLTATNNNPGTFIGGTWAQIASGRTLIGVGTLGSDTYAAGNTGGEATHVLSLAELPAHNHGGATSTPSIDHTHSGTTDSTGAHTHNVPNAVIPGGASTLSSGGARQSGNQISDSAGTHQHTMTTGGASVAHTHTISSQGSGTAHENRPPYLAVYMWQRTA